MPHEHWTHDGDLLEHFVLGRLPEDQHTTFTRHLQSCPDCRKRVEDERIIAAGIRRSGRADMKVRLRQRLGLTADQQHADERVAAATEKPARSPSPRRSGRAWMYTAAAAACVVIITGVGLLNRWWSSEETLLQTSDKDVAIATSPAPKDDRSGVTYKAQAEAQPVGSPMPTTASRPGTLSPPPADGVQNEPRPAAHGAEEKEVQIQEEMLLADMDDSKKKNETDLGQLAGGTYAIEGTWVVGETSALRNEKAASSVRDEISIAKRQKTDTAPSEEGLQRIRATISQRALTDAPVLRQQQRRQAAQTMLTNVQQTDSTLRLTLYPDSQLSERDLSRAQVYRLTADSIVVVLPGQMIRYRMESSGLTPVR